MSTPRRSQLWAPGQTRQLLAPAGHGSPIVGEVRTSTPGQHRLPPPPYSPGMAGGRNGRPMPNLHATIPWAETRYCPFCGSSVSIIPRQVSFRYYFKHQLGVAAYLYVYG